MLLSPPPPPNLGATSFAKYLSMLDATYSSMFNDSVWKDAFEKSTFDKSDSSSRAGRMNWWLCVCGGQTTPQVFAFSGVVSCPCSRYGGDRTAGPCVHQVCIIPGPAASGRGHADLQRQTVSVPGVGADTHTTCAVRSPKESKRKYWIFDYRKFVIFSVLKTTLPRSLFPLSMWV